MARTSDMVSRQNAIDALMDEFKRVPTTAIRAKNRIDRLPFAQPNLQPTCNKLATDAISKREAIEAVEKESQVDGAYGYMDTKSIVDLLNDLPSAQPEIVRCGQCKYAEVADAQDNQDGYTCQFHRESIWFSGSYCSWGKRRTDESD